ncbi:cupin domain-containing protein [Phascolarctobacterium faecium]|uniref:cupin domain-containing protein n=1 Tax=Phascolarctobacterium faecium TaxID=33025 RepID=UPI003AB54166
MKKIFWKKLCSLLMIGAVTGGVMTGLQSTAVAAEVTVQEADSITAELQKQGGTILPIGASNDGYAEYFTGKSYLANLSSEKRYPVFNVTFAHGAHTHWHIHHNSCQVLLPSSGRGYYQIWGKAPQVLLPGNSVTIPAEVKHWHGAAPGTSFQHIALMELGDDVSTEWFEAVAEDVFNSLK